MTRIGKAIPAPPESLQRLKTAAAGDLALARLTLGLFQAVLGREWKMVFPGYYGGLIDCQLFPARLRRDALAVANWASTPMQHDIIEVYRSSRDVEASVIRMRRDSALGRRLRRRVARLMRIHPPIEKGKWGPFGTVFELLSDQCGKPLTERVITLGRAFKPAVLQVVPHSESMNGTWTVGVLTIRLSEDGYTVSKVTLALDVPKSEAFPESRRFEGELVDYFETGTEGVVWMIEDECRHGRGALEVICEGDHLTIEDQLGRTRWRGVIRCDKKTGWQKYPLNPEYGQQCALGHWVHWIQQGFTPDDWARFFIRPDYDRLRGVLVRKPGVKRDPRLGPESV